METQGEDLSDKIASISLSYVRKISSKDFLAEIVALRNKLLQGSNRLDVVKNFELIEDVYRKELEAEGQFNLHEFEFTSEGRSWRIRRTYQDFLNLTAHLLKEYEINEELKEKEDELMSPVELSNFLTRLLQITPLHRKINMIHQFLEISSMNFAGVDEKLMKQMSFAKRSGQKKKKKLWRRIFSSCE